MRAAGVLLAFMLFLAGCSQTVSAPEKPEKESAEREPTVDKQTGEKSTPGPDDKYAAEGAAKAEAANHEMTLADLEKMDDGNAVLLGNCQTYKYQMENGKAAMDRWTEEFVDDVASASSAGDVVSVQEAMIGEGYSCTFGEMNQLAAYGTLEE